MKEELYLEAVGDLIRDTALNSGLCPLSRIDPSRSIPDRVRWFLDEDGKRVPEEEGNPDQDAVIFCASQQNPGSGCVHGAEWVLNYFSQAL